MWKEIITSLRIKKIRKLRRKAKYYRVAHTYGLFGDFRPHALDKIMDKNHKIERGKIILALSPKQAAYRARKRGYGLEYKIGEETTENWARWCVKEDSKPYHWRNLKYFG